MPIYIIRPKANIVSQSLSLGSHKLTLESRRQQTQEVETVYREDSTYRTLTQWAEDIQGKRDIKFLKSPEKLGITGTAIIEMSEDEAKNAQKKLLEFSILKDQTLDLIKPDKITTGFRSEDDLTDNDLWHLKAIKYSSQHQVTGKGITIAVLDTGIDSSHPALRGKITKSVEFDIKQGQVKELANSLDTDGHGTHVAGLICGNRIGVAPDATLTNGLMLPKGRGSLANFIIALEWAAYNPEVQIVNVSAGLTGFVPEMEEVIRDMLAVGVLPVCASGNEGRTGTCSPGNYKSVLSVGASNNKGKVWLRSSSETMNVNYSSYNIPHLVAPGEQVYSSVVQGGYEAWNGTSMATPIVSGVAALLLERYPDLTVLELREELLSRCQFLEQPKERQGLGLIQVGDLS